MQFLWSSSCFLHPGSQVFACDTNFFVFGFDAFLYIMHAFLANLCVVHALLDHDLLNRVVAQPCPTSEFNEKDKTEGKGL